jgi:hypothetical protein
VPDRLLFPQPLSPEQTSSHQHLINYLCTIAGHPKGINVIEQLNKGAKLKQGKINIHGENF